MNFPKRAGVLAPALSLLLMIQLAACSEIPLLQSRADKANAIATVHGWVKSTNPTQTLKIVSYQPTRQQTEKTLSVYIESDGVAYVHGNQSPDPTPYDPIALRLAVQDPNPNTIYLARPCQYLSVQDTEKCHPAYWSSHRYGQDVVSALNEVVEKAKAASGASGIKLYGHSGGGTLAVLLAANRTDVSQIVTVAANLDHELWTRRLGNTPLFGSLNAINYTDRVSHIPQVHLTGSQDEAVAPDIAAAYVRRFGNADNVKHITIKDFDHYCCWAKHWPGLMANYLQ